MSKNIMLTEQHINANEVVYINNADDTVSSLYASSNLRSSYIANICKDVLLPQGYPSSVSDDYMIYQLWDTLQAFCSTITNTLATRSVLQGVGVGDEAASSISAAITWIMKDGVGMTARIVFAWICGTRLDSECKKWRLFADIINDIAICIEIFVLPSLKEYALTILCISTSIKALVGVAGGATRAAITQHQAKRNNMADVSAKDGSQETCVNLIASLVGIMFLGFLGDILPMVWVAFFLLTGLHLFANYKAVKVLNMNKFNEERLNYVINKYLSNQQVASVREANMNESLFPGVGRNYSKTICGYDIKIGSSLREHTVKLSQLRLRKITNLYKGRRYLIAACDESKVLYILINANHTTVDILEAYFHAFIHGIAFSIRSHGSELLKVHPPRNSQSIIQKIKYSVESHIHQVTFLEDFQGFFDSYASKEAPDFIKAVQINGWNTNETYLRIGDWRASWEEPNTSEQH